MASIGIYIADLGPGGVTRFALNLAAGLRERGHDCLLLVDGGDRPPAVDALVFRAQSLWQRVRAMRLAMRTRGLDAVISNGWFADLVCALAMTGLRQRPLLLSVTHVRPTQWGGSRGPLPVRLVKRGLARWALARANGLVAVSNGLAAELRYGGWVAREPQVIYNPVAAPAPEIVEVGSAGRAARAPHRITAMGWLEPRKGFDVLIRALALLPRHLGARLEIIGGRHAQHPGYETYLRALATKVGMGDRVAFLGALADPFPCLANADLFVFPSRSETFGLALVEAMALGLPVVASDCRHGPREILGDDEHGLLVPIDDPEALAGAMVALLCHPERYAHYRQRALERARDFTIERCAGEYEDLLQGLMVPAADDRTAWGW